MSTAVTADELSPDRLAALEEERDFLLKSLADLDAELEAGDIDEADHRALTDDYTARTAEVLRAIEEHRDAVAAARPPRSRSRLLLVVAGVAAVAVLAGVFVAQASGRREQGQTITGGDGITLTATQRARQCLQLTAGGKVTDAVGCYQDVLKDDAQNPTALTYLAWTLVLASDQLDTAARADALSTASRLLDRAVEAAPDFADAYAFRAVIAYRAGDLETARAELDKVDTLDPPASVRSIIDPLRDQIEQERRTTTTTSTTPP